MTESVELFPFDFGKFANFAELDVKEQIKQLTALLADFGVELARPWKTPMAKRDRGAIDKRFRAWGDPTRPTVLYWVGHGWATKSEAALAHVDSPKQVATEGFGPKEMANAISRWEAKAPDAVWLLVVIDACQSGRYAERLAAELDDIQGRAHRIAILGTSTKSSTTLGAFTLGLAAVLEGNFGADETIPVAGLVEELARSISGRRRVLDLRGDEALAS